MKYLKTLCENIPDIFYNYMYYVKNLGFEEDPDYEYLKKLFKSYY